MKDLYKFVINTYNFYCFVKDENKFCIDRCGVIQEGDRVLVVNNIDIINQSAEEVNQLIRDHRHRCDLTVEFDVAGIDTVYCGVIQSCFLGGILLHFRYSIEYKYSPKNTGPRELIVQSLA